MATIFCFSSTGNSLYISKKIAEKIDAQIISMTQDIKELSDDVIGFVFPTHYWRPAKVARQFMSNIKVTNDNAYIFAITTYAGKISYGVLGEVESILKGNCKLSYGKAVKSVCNYIPKLDVNDKLETHDNVDKEIDIIAYEINKRQTKAISSYTIIHKLVYKLFPKHCDKQFIISETCTNCGICEKICPVNNIEVINEDVKFKNLCTHCLACVHACPNRAIDWTIKTMNKKRYINPHIKLDELITLNNPNLQTEEVNS